MKASKYMNDSAYVIVCFVVITLVYYFSLVVASGLRKCMLSAAVPVIFSELTIGIYVYLKETIHRPYAAEEYGLIMILALCFVCTVIGFFVQIIIKTVKKISRKKEKKELLEAYKVMYGEDYEEKIKDDFFDYDKTF